MEVRLYDWTTKTLKEYVTLLGGSGSIALKGKRIEFICQKLLDKKSRKKNLEFMVLPVINPPVQHL